MLYLSDKFLKWHSLITCEFYKTLRSNIVNTDTIARDETGSY